MADIMLVSLGVLLLLNCQTRFDEPAVWQHPGLAGHLGLLQQRSGAASIFLNECIQWFCND